MARRPAALNKDLPRVLWAYEGWQYVTFSDGETIDAQRNFPRALLVGSAALIGN